MLVPTPTVLPRWPAVPYAIVNGTNSSPPRPTPAPYSPNSNAVDKPPAIVPAPQFQPVKIIPAASIPPTPAHAPIAIGTVASAATFLQGYCSELAYTIIDGPTAVWMPVVGCISAKSDCCPTPPVSNAVGSEQSHAQDDARKGAGQFLSSELPRQGTLTGCPRDYHTIDGTACCPSNYWLWSTSLGGQVPCYSSLAATMTPPPIPEELLNPLDASEKLTQSRVITSTDGDGRVFTTTVSPTSHNPDRVSPPTTSQKPTSAIVNIVYTMNYPTVPPSTKMSTGTKIGIGVGVSGAALLIVAVVWYLTRRHLAQRSSEKEMQQLERNSVLQRFGSGVDRSRVAHRAAGVERGYGGKRYAGVAASAVNY